MSIQARKNFTLLEILVVLMLIMFLIGAVFMASNALIKQTNDTKTKAMMKAIEIALENYKNSGLNNYLPSSSYQPFYVECNTNNTNAQQSSLRQFFDKSSLQGMTRYFPEKQADMIQDAYLNPIIYRCPGAVNTQTYDLISMGYDRYPGDRSEVFKKMPPWKRSQFFNTEDMTLNEDFVPFLGQGDDITNYKN